MNRVEKVGNLNGHDGGNFAGNVYNKEKLAPTINTCGGGNTEPMFVDTIKQEGVKDNGIRETLCILRESFGEKAFQEWTIRGFWCIVTAEVLRQNVYAESLYKKWQGESELFKCTYNGTSDKRVIPTEEQLRDMWEEWKARCTPQRRELSEQQQRELDSIMSKLPYETTQRKKIVCNMWEATEGIRVLRETLSEIQKIWKSNESGKVQRYSYRIRKLTARECWRLMDFSDQDYEKAAGVNSFTQLYKQAGNSIVVNVLVAIIGQMIEGKEETYKEQ